MSKRGGIVAGLLLALALLTGCSLNINNASEVSTGGMEWDAGNIISDEMFYNASFFPDATAIQAKLDDIGGACLSPTCLRIAPYLSTGISTQYCSAYPSPGLEKMAQILFKLGKACGINPAVAIVMIQKESQGWTKQIPPAALTGFGCPDGGPNGEAVCNGAVAGVWRQVAGMFEALAKLRKDPTEVNYIEGETHDILWNVAQTGCGSSPVLVVNRATATLYTYTPYQPNAAALAAYPGTGDGCSAYGNRNFFRMFQAYFGSTGGGKPGLGSGSAIITDGVNVTIPNNEFVAAAVRGKTIVAPTAGIATGLAAGFGQLGLPYVWGGSDANGGGPDNGCGRGLGAYNSCGSEIGFDCSGLTGYVIVSGGYDGPGTFSGAQRGSGQDIAWDQGLPGDIVGFEGHVAIYLGVIDGKRYILEASTMGVPIHVVELRRTDYDSVLHRHWSGAAVA